MSRPARRAAAGSQYALIVGLIAVVALLAVTRMGGNISILFTRVANGVSNTGAVSGGSSGGGGPTFSFAPQTGLDGGGVTVTSNAVAAPAGGTASCPTCTEICRNAACTPGTSLGGFSAGDQITLKAATPDLLSASRTVTVTVGDATGSWALSTASPASFDSADGVIFSNAGRTIRLDTALAPGERHGTSLSGTKSTGKWYMEYTLDNAGGSGNQIGIGIWSNNMAGNSFGYAPYIRTGPGGVNAYSTFGSFSGGVIPFNTGSTLPVALDADARKIWIGVGCAWVGGGNPATGTTPTISYSDARYIFPTSYLFLDATGSTAGLQLSGNFGDGAYACTRPAGFLPWRQ